MAKMQSRHVNLTPQQMEAVEAYAKGKQIPVTEALRRIVDEWMDRTLIYTSIQGNNN